MSEIGLRQILVRVVQQEFFRAKIAAIYYLRKRLPKKSVFILCYPRTGSNLLVSYLNSNPGASFGGEILSRRLLSGLNRKFISKKAVFNHVRYFLNYCAHSVCGIKIFFEHLGWRLISLKEFSDQFPDARWIVLYRENILDQYISFKIASKTDRWVRYRGEDFEKTKGLRIKLPVRSAIGYRNRIRKQYENALKIPEICARSLWISYEELASNPQELFDEAIFPFLELEGNRVHTNLIKQNIWPHRETIANYEEVRNLIEQTDFTQTYERYPRGVFSP